MTRLATTYPWAFEQDSGTYVGVNWAHQLAKVVFSKGVSLGFDQYIEFVFGSNTSNALAQISQSLDEVNDRIASVEEAIRRLEESTAKAAFIAAEGFAKTYARDIHAHFKLIDGWDRGHEFDPSDVQDLVNTTYTAIEQLDTHLLGPYGTQELLKELLSFGDRSESWEQQETYRAGYRASLATGLMNLQWAAEYDAKHLNQLEIARATADGTAAALFETGLRHEVVNPSRDSRITRGDGSVTPLDVIFGTPPSPSWHNVRFDVSDGLPPTLAQDGRIQMRWRESSWNYYDINLHDTRLEVDLYSGAVTGTASGSIRYSHEGPDFNWSFSSAISGHVDLQGSGRMTLDIPFQNMTGSHGRPFTNAQLILDPA